MYLIMIIYYLIEIWFNQIKHTLKLNKKVLKFNELKLEVKKVKKKNYENHFEYAYNKNNKTIKNRNTRKVTKNYKNYKSYNTIIFFLLFEPIV